MLSNMNFTSNDGTRWGFIISIIIGIFVVGITLGYNLSENWSMTVLAVVAFLNLVHAMNIDKSDRFKKINTAFIAAVTILSTLIALLIGSGLQG